MGYTQGQCCAGCGVQLEDGRRYSGTAPYCSPKCYQRQRMRRMSKLGARKPKRCRICLQTGHNAATCQQQPSDTTGGKR